MSIEEKIRSILAESEAPTAAQLSYPGATNPQDPLIPTVGYEVLELDRPGVTGAEEMQQVAYPGQSPQDPEPLAPEFEELDPYNPAADISDNAAKENYPVGSGADDVAINAEDPNAAPENQFSAGIQKAAEPAPFIAESYSVHKPKKVAAKSEGKVVVLDDQAAEEIEKKLGLKKGALSAKTGSKYSETLVVKGEDNKLHTIYSHNGSARIRAYGHSDHAATEELKKHLTEAAEVQPEPQAQAQEPVATPAPAQDQEDILAQAVAAVQAGNTVEDVAKATGIDPKELQDAVDAATPAASPTAPVTTAPVSESELKQDVETLLGEETLSEEFKSKATALFESAVIARVNNEVLRIEESYNTKLDEQVKHLQEEYANAVEAFADKQSQRLNKYINYLGEQWLKQNRLEVQAGIRTELTEGFMQGLQKLFTEHYINVPEEKLDIVEEQVEKVAQLEESLKASQETIAQLQEEKSALEKQAVLAQLSEGLTDIEAEKLKTLCEGIPFDSANLFEERVQMIKGNFFKQKPINSPEQLLESTIQVAPKEEVEAKPKKDQMSKYVEALNRFKPV